MKCSFCSKTQEQVKVLVTGDSNTTICDECTAEAVAIVAKRLRALREQAKPNLKIEKG